MKQPQLNSLSLQERIDQLELLQQEQIADIKEATTGLLTSLTPAHIIKSAFRDLKSSPDFKAAALDTAMGIGAGFIGRKLTISKSSNIFRKVVGTAVQFLVTNFVRNKMSKMRANGREEDENE